MVTCQAFSLGDHFPFRGNTFPPTTFLFVLDIFGYFRYIFATARVPVQAPTCSRTPMGMA
jgi:hypothetical protein